MSQAVLTGQRQGAASLSRDYLELSKARIVLMVLITTAAGFLVASPGRVDLGLLAHALIGTAFLAAGTNALNQYAEREHDALMKRTRHRPLPGGRITPRAALIFSVAVSVFGTLYLAAVVNLTTAALGLFTLASYVFVYTPLKRRTTLCTIVGAVPGAIPPMMGWAAVTGGMELGSWILFAIMFLWQLPHFLAIAWLYREDYASAGFEILTVADTDGEATAQQALVYSFALLPVSLLPWFAGITGPAYFAGALVSGTALIIAAGSFARARSLPAARKLFVASIFYLVVVMFLMVVSSPG